MFTEILHGLIFCIFLNGVIAIETTRELEGYPNGYLYDCPGSTKEARISKRSLRKLSFFHLGEGNFLVANRTEYNYFQMKRLAANIDFKKKTLLFMNGYPDSNRFSVVSAIMGAYYTRYGYNVLLLEYVQFSAMEYPLAARLVRAVGKRTAEMLAELTTLGLNPKRFEVAGISLGGQGISFIGKNYQRITGRNISRITALDPSGPCFRRLGPKERIDASDADLVDIIHTNSEAYGIAGAVGTVNFYVNGGEFQTNDLREFPCTSMCSHAKSFNIWASSLLNPDSFIGVKCKSVQDARDRNCFDEPLVTNLMGPKTDVNKPGIYYLNILNSFPYYTGKKGIEKDFDFDRQYMMHLNRRDVLVV